MKNTAQITNEGIAILCSELFLQLNYIEKCGNLYKNIENARTLVNKLNNTIPAEDRIR